MTAEGHKPGEDDGAGVTLFSPTDSKHWEIVQAVANLHRQGMDTQAACKQLGIGRTTYYRALQNPIVRDMRLQQIQAMSEASTTVIDRNWVRILNNMARIAHSGEDREAVQAARFLNEVRKDLENEAARDQAEADEFGDWMARFASAPNARLRARHKTRDGRLTIEVEATNDSPSDVTTDASPGSRDV